MAPGTPLTGARTSDSEGAVAETAVGTCSTVKEACSSGFGSGSGSCSGSGSGSGSGSNSGVGIPGGLRAASMISIKRGAIRG